jgi:hypothetical protein
MQVNITRADVNVSTCYFYNFIKALKMKKSSVVTMLCVILTNFVFAQQDMYNLEKYWRYKNRFLNEFIVLPQFNSTSEGLSIPAMKITLNQTGTSKAYMDFTDGNANMSHYLGVLATEYRLLKNNGDNYDQVIKELYYATLALDRLDQNSESYFRLMNTVFDTDKNGWMIRDDVTPGYWTANWARLGFPSGDPTQFVSGYHGDGIYNKESYSQDMVFHLLEGLALVNKLVDAEYVDIANKQVDFALWARQTTTRLIRMMQNTQALYLIHDGGVFNCAFPEPRTIDWVIAPQVVLAYKVGCEKFQSRWYIKNPATNELAAQGSGEDFDTWSFYSYGLVRAGNKITGEDYNFDHSSDELQRQIYTSWFNANSTLELQALGTAVSTAVSDFITSVISGIVFGVPAPTHLPPSVEDEIINQISAPTLSSDPYKVKTLGAVGNVFGGDTFWSLRASELKVPKPRYFHLMLINLILYGAPDYSPGTSQYLEDKTYLSNLLFQAPCNGPRSSGTLPTADNYNVEWSSTSRLVWPENNGVTSDRNGVQNWKFNGLDYMLLHNLYCLAYGSHFQKLSTKVTDDVVGKTKNEKAVEIIASDKISGGSTVTYVASKITKLTTGFWVSSDSKFTAKTSSNTDYNAFNQNNTCIPHISSSRAANTSEETDDALSVVNEDRSNNLTIIPNPNNGTFNVILKTSLAEGATNQITIVDLTGQVVFKDAFDGNSLNVSLPQIKSKGLFIVSVVCKGKRYQSKLIIE